MGLLNSKVPLGRVQVDSPIWLIGKFIWGRRVNNYGPVGPWHVRSAAVRATSFPEPWLQTGCLDRHELCANSHYPSWNNICLRCYEFLLVRRAMEAMKVHHG